MFETLFGVVLALVLAVAVSLFKLVSERRRKQEQIAEGIEKGLVGAEDKGYKRGYTQAAEKYGFALSQPVSPKRLPPGKYKVEYVVQNGPVPLAAVVSRETIHYADGKETGRAKDAWFISLPYNRRLTQPVPFTLVVDEAGIGYEPWQGPIVPPTEPPKADEAAA